jgi:hypothetical protein
MPKIGVGSRGTWNMPRRDQPSVGAHRRLVPTVGWCPPSVGARASLRCPGPRLPCLYRPSRSRHVGPQFHAHQASRAPQSLPGARLQQASPGTNKTDQTQIGFLQSPSYTMPTLRAQGQEDGIHPLLHSRLDHARASICRAAEVREGSCRLLADGDATHPCKAPAGPFRQMSRVPLVGQRAGEHAMRPVEEGVSGRPRN